MQPLLALGDGSVIGGGRESSEGSDVGVIAVAVTQPVTADPFI